MKTLKTKFFIKIGLLSAPVILIVIIYLLFDPFKVIYKYPSYFKSGEPAYITLNLDYISTETFIQKYSVYKYNSFIFGNSRSIFYEIKNWQKYISSNKCFHFPASNESIYGIDKKINYLKSQNIQIKNALVILDYYTLQTISDSKGHLFIKHPILSGNSYYSFQMEFLKAFFDIGFIKAYLLLKFFNIKAESLDNNPWDYNSENNELKWTYYEKIINNNPDDYFLPRKSLFYHRDTIQQYFPQVIVDEQKRMLSEISNKLKEDKTNYKIIINPLYDQVKLNSADLAILKSIFGKENVFDFSGINSFTNNMYNYYEISHYRPCVADTIMSLVYR